LLAYKAYTKWENLKSLKIQRLCTGFGLSTLVGFLKVPQATAFKSSSISSKASRRTSSFKLSSFSGESNTPILRLSGEVAFHADGRYARYSAWCFSPPVATNKRAWREARSAVR